MKRKYTKFKVGDRFHRLVVIRLPVGKKALCRCDCGVEKLVGKTGLRIGTIASCGCFYRESRVSAAMTHGQSSTAGYKAWYAMKERCSNPNHKHYRHYGGRGITVCKRWHLSYQNFVDDMGVRPVGMSLDRINVDGNYEPGNCQWATQKEQCLNRRPQSVWIVDGQQYSSLSNAAKTLGKSAQTIMNWCAGYVTKKGAKIQPKAGCSVMRFNL